MLPALGLAAVGLGLGLGIWDRINAQRNFRRALNMPMPYYQRGLELYNQLVDPNFGLGMFTRLAQRSVTPDAYAQIYAMRGGSPLQAQLAFQQAQRQSMLGALDTYRQFRMGALQTAAGLLGQGMGLEAERMGLAAQNVWQGSAMIGSLANQMLMMGTTLYGLQSSSAMMGRLAPMMWAPTMMGGYMAPYGPWGSAFF